MGAHTPTRTAHCRRKAARAAARTIVAARTKRSDLCAAILVGALALGADAGRDIAAQAIDSVQWRVGSFIVLHVDQVALVALQANGLLVSILCYYHTVTNVRDSEIAMDTTTGDVQRVSTAYSAAALGGGQLELGLVQGVGRIIGGSRHGIALPST